MGETRCDVNSDTFFLRLQPLKAGNANETKSWRGWGGLPTDGRGEEVNGERWMFLSVPVVAAESAYK